MKLTGCPTFTDLRTSIASHVSVFLATSGGTCQSYRFSPFFHFQAKYTHGDEDRLKVTKFMCHDVKTADKFYAMNLTAKQAMEHRRLFEAVRTSVI